MCFFLFFIFVFCFLCLFFFFFFKQKTAYEISACLVGSEMCIRDRTIADIVENEGWESFRARETATLEAVTVPSTVIATGGGIILAPYNRQFMREKGVVIYLCAPVSTLVGRLEAFPEEGQRPALTAKPLSEEVSDVLAERDALYREAAHHVVDASASPEKVAIQIITALRLACAS